MLHEQTANAAKMPNAIDANFIHKTSFLKVNKYTTKVNESFS